MRPNMKRGAKSEWGKRLVSISASAILRRSKRPSPNPQIQARVGCPNDLVYHSVWVGSKKDNRSRNASNIRVRKLASEEALDRIDAQRY
jgi:hypothetical protein